MKPTAKIHAPPEAKPKRPLPEAIAVGVRSNGQPVPEGRTLRADGRLKGIRSGMTKADRKAQVKTLEMRWDLWNSVDNEILGKLAEAEKVEPVYDGNGDIVRETTMRALIMKYVRSFV